MKRNQKRIYALIIAVAAVLTSWQTSPMKAKADKIIGIHYIVSQGDADGTFTCTLAENTGKCKIELVTELGREYHTGAVTGFGITGKEYI